jgi:hypothetical protein
MSFTSWLRNRISTRSRKWEGFPIRPTAPRFRPRLEMLEDRCVPSTLTVTNTLDSGMGSLRYEIAQAHNNDTIVFNFGKHGNINYNNYPHTVTLTSGELVINKNLTIQGPGAGVLTITSEPYTNELFQQENGSRIFEVDGANTTVTVSGLTISAGGGTAYGGEFGQPYDGYGGAILNFGTLTVSACDLVGNSADYGGAIANFGRTAVTGCTLSNNFAYYEGGGIYNAGTAGALTVRDSIFSSNRPDNIYGPYTDGGGNTFS